MTGARKAAKAVNFIFWLMAGMAFGMILMAFLAVGVYQRGYEAGSTGRKAWRTELTARRRAHDHHYERAMTGLTALRSEVTPDPATARLAAAGTGR